MSELNIRVTHRTEIDGRSVERTIDIETIPPFTSTATLQSFNSAPDTRGINQAKAVAAAPIKILADGTQVPASDPRTDHVAVLYPDTGWMVHPITLTDNGDAFDNHAVATKACKDLRILGFENWELAPREVWERHVLDLTRHDPAVDPALYPGIRSGWHHTSTDCAWSKDSSGVASSAWLVYTDYGNVNDDHRDNSGFGLAARRVDQ